MSGTIIAVIVAVVVVAVVVAVAAVLVMKARRRSAMLRDRFGPEYDNVYESEGSRRAAERELAGRAERHDTLELRPLSPAVADRYRTSWLAVQQRFVDEPVVAVDDADRLVTELMEDRGYPTADFDERAALLSADHAQVIDDYRLAHGISVASRENRATTEDLRLAMVSYRSLFDALLLEGAPTTRSSRA